MQHSTSTAACLVPSRFTGERLFMTIIRRIQGKSPASRAFLDYFGKHGFNRSHQNVCGGFQKAVHPFNRDAIPLPPGTSCAASTCSGCSPLLLPRPGCLPLPRPCPRCPSQPHLPPGCPPLPHLPPGCRTALASSGMPMECNMCQT